MLKSIFLSWAITAAAAARSYTDSKGIVHTTNKDKPKIVIFAHRAVSMRHYGLDKSQLVGVYGEWYNSGSDVDVDAPELGSSLPADPLHEDIKFLREVVDLSPNCHVGYCTEFNLDTFLDLEVDELLIHGYRGEWWGQNATYSEYLIQKATEKLGKPPIYLELSREGSDKCPDSPTTNESKCPGLSMIDLIEENYEVARYLNLDVPQSLNADRQTLCNSAMTFQANMKTAHSNGVRVMAAYLTTSTSYIADPVSDSVLRMFEELGMPIIHPGKCMTAGDCSGNYFWEYMTLNKYFQSCPDGAENVTSSCNGNPFYPVDMWLYDHRTTLRITDPDFAIGFPDKAIEAGQKAYWPIGGRLITPRDAAEILDIVGPQVAKASRLHPQTGCIEDIDVTGEDHRATGMMGGNYACYNGGIFFNKKYFEECQFFESPTESESSDVSTKSDISTKSDLSTGSIAGIGAGGGFVAIGLVAVALISHWF